MKTEIINKRIEEVRFDDLKFGSFFAMAAHCSILVYIKIDCDSAICINDGIFVNRSVFDDFPLIKLNPTSMVLEKAS